MDAALLETGLTVEYVKRRGIDMYQKMSVKVSSLIDNYDKTHSQIATCTKDIRCESIVHKHNCAVTDDYHCDCWMCKGEREPYLDGVW